MKLNFTKKFTDVNFIIESDKYYYCCTYFGFQIIDKENDKVIKEVYDFFDADSGELIEDKYLVLVKERLSIRVYDAFNGELISEKKNSGEESISVFEPYYDKLDHKLYILSRSTTESFFSGNSLDFPQIELDTPLDEYSSETDLKESLNVYDLPTLKECEEVTKFGTNISKIDRVPFNSAFLISKYGNLASLLDEEGKELYCTSNFSNTYVIDNKRRQIITRGKYGIRFLDEKLQEIDKIDVISDVKEKLNNPLFAIFTKGGMSSEENPKIAKESILSLQKVDDDTIAIFVHNNINSFSNILFFDLDSKTVVENFSVNCRLERIECDNKREHIFVKIRGNVHLFEVEK